MASNNASSRKENKKKAVRVIAIFACAALLVSAILPFLAGIR